MTAAPAVESVVTVERHGNVAFVRWHTPEPPSSGMSSGEGTTPARRRDLPIRYSPRPVHALRCRLTRERAVIAGLLLAGLLCTALHAAGVGQ